MVLCQYYSVMCKKEKRSRQNSNILKVNEKIPFKLNYLSGKEVGGLFLFLKRGYT